MAGFSGLLLGMHLGSVADAESTALPQRGDDRVPAAITASFDVDARRLTLAVTGVISGGYEVSLVTPGLRDVERGGDVNEPGIIYLPPPKDEVRPAAEIEETENLFFFNDLVTADGWDLVISFPSEVSGAWKLNGRFSPLGGALQREVRIPVGRLEEGENLLHLRGFGRVLPVLSFRREIPVSAGEAKSFEVSVTRPDWSAQVRLLNKDANGSERISNEQSIAGVLPLSRATIPGERCWENTAGLTDALQAVGRHLLSMQVRRQDSFFDGGFNLVYDPGHRAHRMAHWIWAWGPAIDLLLKLESTEAARSAGLSRAFHEAALAAGRRSLLFGVTDPSHPAFGVSTVRWEPSRATPLGMAEYISTADSLFLAGWGWMSLHTATGEPVYLERTQALVAAAERLMKQYPVIPQDWIVERARWTPHTLDESVFGMIAFRRLAEATNSGEIAEGGRRYIESHLSHMAREGGLLTRAWMRDEDKGIWDPDIKGHGWVMEGYLDAHRVSGDAKYLELARSLATKVMACQSGDGSWTFFFKQAMPGDAIDDKATAIWAYLFYDLYKSTRDPVHLAAARRALGWCWAHQYRGEDPDLDGGVVNVNGMAYVRRRPITVLYTTTFFGLALLEELDLQAPERVHGDPGAGF